MLPETPADWLRQGQAHEAANTADSVASAVESYRQAIALLKAESPSDQGQRALGIALMNLGNARQKQPDAGAVDETVRAYDEAIALLQSGAAAGDFELRNSIGAAWMNRGHALQRGASSGATTAALLSYDQAIALLETLPPGENRFFVLNLAAAWLNRAQALLTFPTPEATSAHTAAGNALKLVIGNARTDPVAADIALKTYHALCASLSHQLSRGPSPVLVAETSDAIDESLALVRHWELQGVQNIRPFEIVFFRFGARFYLAHQPQFIAEFLLETLAHVRAPGVTPDNGELQTIATSALAQVRSDVYNRSLLNPKDDRLALLRQELDEAAQKFAQFFRTPEPTAGTALA
jgi:tetratricopeptide (TPR) repeat protein